MVTKWRCLWMPRHPQQIDGGVKTRNIAHDLDQFFCGSLRDRQGEVVITVRTLANRVDIVGTWNMFGGTGQRLVEIEERS